MESNRIRRSGSLDGHKEEKVTEGNLALKGRGRIIKALFIVYWLRGGCIISGFVFPNMLPQSSAPPNNQPNTQLRLFTRVLPSFAPLFRTPLAPNPPCHFPPVSRAASSNLSTLARGPPIYVELAPLLPAPPNPYFGALTLPGGSPPVPCPSPHSRAALAPLSV